VAVERHALAVDLVDELERLNTQRKALRKRIAAAVDASGTTLTEIFGAGDVGAAIILGQVGDVRRFRTADRFAAYNGTAPIEWSIRQPGPADPPALPTRQPHPEPRNPHRRSDPAPAPPQPRPRLLRRQAHPRPDRPSRAPLVEAAHQ
jgi:hypothetical protein